MLQTKKKPIKLVETIFDITYLTTVLVSALILFLTSSVMSERWLFGIIALILCIGDSFHLVPRIMAMWDKKSRNFTVPLGFGKMVASITMTVFYVVLWHIGLNRFPELFPTFMTKLIYILAALRILLCLFPQNRWFSETQPMSWSILRNIPFFLLGMIVMVYFAMGSFKVGGFSFLWLAILISFACYLPVVLFAHKNSKIGMLMLPKSCAYAAMVLMAFSQAIK